MGPAAFSAALPRDCLRHEPGERLEIPSDVTAGSSALINHYDTERRAHAPDRKQRGRERAAARGRLGCPVCRGRSARKGFHPCHVDRQDASRPAPISERN